MGRPPGTTVFVGNISYDTTEDQLKEVFSQVGNVISFRLKYDHETGRAKGFGFCEYEDKETAMSARRNLNGTELNGRPLRVDLTESDKQNPAINGLAIPPSTTSAQQSNPQLPNPQKPSSQSSAQSHPALPPALASANPSMAMMTPAEIHETMIHLKKAVVQSPNAMHELLMANPRLAHAILQGQMMLGMVPPPIMPMPPQQQNVPQQPQQPQQNIPPISQQTAPPPPAMMGPPPPGMMPPSMQQGMPPQAPPLQEEQTALLSRVMAMTQQEINELPREHRDQVLQLKEFVSMNSITPGMPPAMGQGMPPPGQPPPPPPGQQYR